MAQCATGPTMNSHQHRLSDNLDCAAASHSITLPQDMWRQRQEEHQREADALTQAAQERRTAGRRHPVWDFMFSYYPVTPGKLRRWHPGVEPGKGWVGLELGVDSAACRTPKGLPVHKNHYRRYDTAQGVVWAVDPEAFWSDRGTSVTYMHRLLQLTEGRQPQFGCFGLHEWAMVYRDRPRHPEPLRLGAEGTNAVVEAGKLKCTHIDAFRFFTPAAAPLNEHKPTRKTQADFEQPGCLHATMDLYKWATKLMPLVPGHVWLDTFRLACDIRRLDMEASPYDLREWGFAPVRVETPEGRACYVRRQRELTERGQQLRRILIEILETAFPGRLG